MILLEDLMTHILTHRHYVIIKPIHCVTDAVGPTKAFIFLTFSFPRAHITFDGFLGFSKLTYISTFISLFTLSAKTKSPIIPTVLVFTLKFLSCYVQDYVIYGRY